jgi:hypothetical protein
MSQQRYWIAVASKDHVARGLKLGIMQVCRGKASPLRRLQPGDGISYYSPRLIFGGSVACQCFTATGTVRDDLVYQVDMGNGFHPYRRQVDYLLAEDAPIQPLLAGLSVTRDRRNWGSAFRFGLLQITAADHQLIVTAMTEAQMLGQCA